MNDQQFDDLKQLIETAALQTEARLGAKIDGVEQRLDGVEQQINALAQETRDGFAGVGDAIEAIEQRLDDRDTDIDRRLAKLEQYHATS